jgi:hypothetical protein
MHDTPVALSLVMQICNMTQPTRPLMYEPVLEPGSPLAGPKVEAESPAASASRRHVITGQQQLVGLGSGASLLQAPLLMLMQLGLAALAGAAAALQWQRRQRAGTPSASPQKQQATPG